MTSTPTFDATPISGDPATAGRPWTQIQDQPGNPLVDRDRQGHYTPGSIMKIFTAAAALDAGAITPQTTFPDQPRQETEGFVVDGFRVPEHDLSPVQPALWALSEALQVSSNIFFAHVGLELGAEAFLDYARRFGFCSGLAIGPPPGAAGGGVLRHRRRTATARHSAIGPSSPRPPSGRGASRHAGRRWPWWRRRSPTTASCRTRTSSATCAPTPTGRPGPSDQCWRRCAGGGSRVVSSGRRPRCARPWSTLSRASWVGSTPGRAPSRLRRPRRRTAGKTGTAERGRARRRTPGSSASRRPRARPRRRSRWRCIVEGGGSGSGRAAPIGGAVMAEWLKILSAGG